MRQTSIRKWLCGASLALAAMGSPRPASADGGVSLDRFYPSLAGDRLFSAPSPYVAGERAVHLMLLGDYAHNPLVAEDANGERAGAVVANQFFLHINGTIALWSRVGINVDVPIALAQGGDSPADSAGVAVLSPSSAQLADLRVSARVRLFGSYFEGFQLAAAGYLWLPSGSDQPGSFVGDGSVRGMPEVIAGGRTSWLVWSGALGVEIRGAQRYGDVEQGTMFHARGGAGFLVDEGRRFQIGPEISFATVLTSPGVTNTNLEILGSARYRLFDFEAGVGAGLGLAGGLGTPDFRGLFMVAYTPEMQRARAAGDANDIVDPARVCEKSGADCVEGKPAPTITGLVTGDRDGDSISDASDACPDAAGVPNEDAAKHGCPAPVDRPKPPPAPPDRDKDRIADDADACPDAAGPGSSDPAKNGCPPDSDGDGIIDINDACRDTPGVPTVNPATSGCPGDTDNDGITDDKDACPKERGKVDADATKNGCPLWVRVTDEAIVLLDTVKFEMGKAAILPASEGLLDDAADALKQHPEIIKVEVQGHTDDRGEPRYNQKISDERAAAVVVALMQRGIDASRLISKGYGSTMPIEKNIYEAGRQKNRRIEIKITQRTPK